MKRSEMIIRLQEILVELPEDIEHASEALLLRIERAGMIPPIEPGRTVYDLDLGIPEWEEE